MQSIIKIKMAKFVEQANEYKSELIIMISETPRSYIILFEFTIINRNTISNLYTFLDYESIDS